MLSIFPTLLIFEFLAPTILRLTIGVVFLNFGWTKLKRQKEAKTAFFESIGLKPGLTYVWLFGLLEMAIGILFVIGLFTQIAALLSIIILLGAIHLRKKQPASFESSSGFFWVLLAIAVSLLFTGPGLFAFDLPL